MNINTIRLFNSFKISNYYVPVSDMFADRIEKLREERDSSEVSSPVLDARIAEIRSIAADIFGIQL